MVTPQRAVGTFTVQMKPQGELSAVPEGASPLGRMSLDKVFSGDKAGSSVGEMLTAVTPTAGYAGYVAIETIYRHRSRPPGQLRHAAQRHGEPARRPATLHQGRARLRQRRVARHRRRVPAENQQGQHHYTLEYTLPA